MVILIEMLFPVIVVMEMNQKAESSTKALQISSSVSQEADFNPAE